MGSAVLKGLIGALVGLLVSACGESTSDRGPMVAAAGAGGSSAGSGAGSASGSSGAGGSGAGGGGGAGTDGTAGSGGALDACPGPTPAGPKASGRLDVPMNIVVNGADLVVGEAATTSAGTDVRVSLFKFFVTQPTLMAAGGTEVEAELVTEAGLPAPYGLLLVDADDETSQLLRLAAPAGTYEGLRFGVGVPEPCNSGDPTTHVYPLNADGDMWWPWGNQYMFIRIEGFNRATETADWSPFMFHVGFQAAFTTVTLPGVFDVGATPTTASVTLTMDVGHLLAPREGSTSTGNHGMFDGWVVDNIDDNQVFSLQ